MGYASPQKHAIIHAMPMILPALVDFWNDFLTITGFFLTAIGFVLTLLSLLYAIRQIKKATTAAQAARDAATATLTESRRDFQRYVAANSHRYVNEAIIHVENQDWGFAAARLNDLADQVAQLAHLDPEWKQFADELRTWGVFCRKIAAGERKRLEKTKWHAFTLRLQAKIDKLYGPFRESKQE